MRLTRLGSRALALIVATALFASGARAEEVIRFDAAANRLDVRLANVPLEDALAQLSAATGWEVFVDPDARRTVTARLEGAPAGQALARLLGDLNYALLPREAGSARLLVFRTNADDATRRVAPATAKKGGAKRVPNELLLKLKPGADADALARSLGAKITGRLDSERAYRLKFDDDNAAQAAKDSLANNNLVEDAGDNYYIERPDTAQPLSASSVLPFSLKPDVSTDSSRVVIGLIDTAVQPTGAGYDAFLLPAVSLFEGYKPDSQSLLHGTPMFETLMHGAASASEDCGNTSAMRVLPVDIYGPNPTTTTFDVAWGISKAINPGGATIINLSLGSQGDSRILQTLIANARQEGVIFFGAAGNSPNSEATYPAAYPQVVAVTAGDKRGTLAPYANYGSFVDVIGPGTSIVGFNNRSYIVNGTSSATAFMSGMAAGLASCQRRSPAQIETRIRQTFSFKPPAK